MASEGGGITGYRLRALLSKLDADEDRAADKYEYLRRKLITFFAGRGCVESEDLFDKVVDRLSRRIEEGEVIEHLASYAYGIARKVLAESSRRRERWHRLTSGAAAPPGGRGQDGVDPRMECLRSCAARLEAMDWTVVLDYYQDDGREQQESRRRLAERLGLSPVALRLRVFRIRRALETCTRHCLDRGPVRIAGGRDSWEAPSAERSPRP
jgi:DNA-directed RNA polymerase specialized sigma24 family protein